MSTPELQQYMALAQETMRRVYAEEDPTMLHQWLIDQLGRMRGVTDGNAVMTWPESFDYYDQLLAQREADALLPEDQRKVIDWKWESWNKMLDPLEPGMLAVVSAGDGMGKCLGRGTKVVMYDGTLRSVEDVRIGDLLMGPDSKPRKVLSLGYGVEQMYWVHQNSGISYRANSAHILALLKRDKKGNKTHCEMTISEVRKLPKWYIKKHLQGYKVPVDFPHKDVPLDPYFLGLWLGDGFKHSSSIFTADSEIVEYLKSYATKHGAGITVQPDKDGGKCLRVIVSNGRGGGRIRNANTPSFQLFTLGLIGNKRIPQEYISNSESVRLSLLAGLIDSDGYYDKSSKSYEITQNIKPLAYQIKLLADSLGFRTSVQEKTAEAQNGASSLVWRIRIMGDIERVPVLIERKKATSRTINKDWRVTGIQIEEDKIDEFFGFYIDGDGLFLLEDMTVTHNTIYAESLAEHWACKKNRVVFLHYELNRAIVLDRRTARHTSISRRILKGGRLSAEEKRTIAAMRPKLLAWDGYITYVHTAGWTMERTIQELHRLKVEGQCDVVVLDYLEKNAPSRRQLQMFGTNTYQREADNVEQLKNFAESTETPVLMLAQMSKAGKTGSAETIDRTGMRGAGEKSEKANVVILLHREKIENGYSQKVDVVIDKNTLGPTGSFPQWMEPEYFRVQEMERVPLN